MHRYRPQPFQESEEIVAHGAKGAVVGLTNTQTLTNKTLTSPVINSATGIGQAKVVRKTADETVNNSTTLQDDDVLKWTVAANEVWAFEFFLRVSSEATPDFKAGWTVPSGASMAWARVVAAPAELNAGETLLVATFGGGIYDSVFCRGVVVNGANAGTVQLQWAQNTADASNTQALANSWIIAHRLA